MTRLHGRCQRGKRLHFAAPHNHCKTTTMISSIRVDGSTACMTIDGATDTEVFRAYVTDILLPTLRAGDIVVMDNLTPHKNEKTIAIIESVGATVRFLPPYSPDLNPIENMWSKIKAFLRSTAARTYEDLLKTIANALDSVSASDAKNWFAYCGYNFI
jgi:transposase